MKDNPISSLVDIMFHIVYLAFCMVISRNIATRIRLLDDALCHKAKVEALLCKYNSFKTYLQFCCVNNTIPEKSESVN